MCAGVPARHRGVPDEPVPTATASVVIEIPSEEDAVSEDWVREWRETPAPPNAGEVIWEDRRPTTTRSVHYAVNDEDIPEPFQRELSALMRGDGDSDYLFRLLDALLLAGWVPPSRAGERD